MFEVYPSAGEGDSGVEAALSPAIAYGESAELLRLLKQRSMQSRSFVESGVVRALDLQQL